MGELLLVIGVIVVVAGGITFVAPRLDLMYRVVERALAIVSIAIILFVMSFVFAEVIMRYAFNSPIPGHLEGSELLVPMIVFFAISYTQSMNGHVGMNIIVDSMPPRIQLGMKLTTLTLSILTCAVLSYFSFKHAWHTWEIDDVTMTPPYWKIWPSALAIPIGYFAISIRMYLQILQMIRPEYMPPPLVDDSDLHSAE